MYRQQTIHSVRMDAAHTSSPPWCDKQTRKTSHTEISRPHPRSIIVVSPHPHTVTTDFVPIPMVLPSYETASMVGFHELQVDFNYLASNMEMDFTNLLSFVMQISWISIISQTQVCFRICS